MSFTNQVPDELADEVKRLLTLGHQSQIMGVGDKKSIKVAKPGQDPLSVQEKITSIEADGDGFIDNYDEIHHPLDCGHTASNMNKVAGKDYLTDEIVCMQCLLPCEECRKLIARHNIKIVRIANNKMCCKPCAKKLLIKTVLLFPLRMIKECVYGVVGLEIKKEVPEIFNSSPGINHGPTQLQSPPTGSGINPTFENSFPVRNGNQGGFV